MAIQHSDTVRNAILEAIETAIGPSAKIRIYTGSPPTNCASPPSGTLLAEFPLASDWANAAGTGSKALTSVTGVTGIGNGIAGHYRFCANSGAVHEQGTISVTGGGGDAIIDDASISIGQAVNVLTWVWNQPGG